MKKILVLFFIFPTFCFAMPSYPMSFWGNVNIDNSPAPIGTVIRAYYASSTLAGDVVVKEIGIYGYNDSLKQKLLVAEGTGAVSFKFQTPSKNNGVEMSGCASVSYASFTSGLTVQKDLAFKTTGCDSSAASPVTILSVLAPQTSITNTTDATNISVNNDVTNATVDVSSLVSAAVVNNINVVRGTLPAINIESQAANVTISASTLVTSASTTWSGIMEVPKTTTITLPTESGVTKTLSTAIEVGFSGAALTFDKAVKIVLANQAGKRAGYTRDGGITFTEITNTCTSNTESGLGVNSDCKIDAGFDLVIWTKHFTTFATYSQTTNQTTSSSGGGGGGGGGFFPSTAVATTTIAITTAVAPVVTLPEAPASTVSNYKFTKSLTIGSIGTDVTELQKILVSEGYLVMPTGVAYGMFGNLTKDALVKYQLAKGISPAVGYFGPITINKINSSYTTAQVQTPATPNTPNISDLANMTLKQFLVVLLQIGAVPQDKIDIVNAYIKTI